MHHKKFSGGAYSNKFPQNVNRMRTMVGPGADMSFKGGDYSNKFPQSVSRMRTMVGPGADMSFVGGAYSDKFPVIASHTNEQSGFSKANNFGHGGTLHDGNSYFSANNHDSFNPRNNHSNAAGGGMTAAAASVPWWKGVIGGGGASSPGVGGANIAGGCTPPNVYCQAGDYWGCHPQHKCNGGGARQVNKKSRRSSADRISVNPVKGAERQIGGGGMNDCGQRCGQAYPGSYTCPSGCYCDDKGRGTCQPIKSRKAPSSNLAKMNASGCGYNNFHHKASFSSNVSKYNTFV